MALYVVVLVGFAALVAWLWWMLLPRVLPEIPYRRASTRRLLGDLPEIGSYSKKTGEYSGGIFAIAQELGSPIAQFLTTKFDNPTIIIDDPREVEDILLRRNREFDRAGATIAMFDSLMPESTIAQTTTPKLRAQKRQWADVMNTEFLRQVAAPKMQQAGVDLVRLWRLKAAQAKGQSFPAHEDLSDVALDAIWAAILGDMLGVTQAAIDNLSSAAETQKGNRRLVRDISPGATVSKAVEYANNFIGGGVISLWPDFYYWRRRHTSEFRHYITAVDTEINRILLAACERFEQLSETDSDKYDTCAMDLVLRRELLRTKKAGQPPIDPTKSRPMKDELLLLLAAGHDSTSTTMAWFVKLIALYPHVQSELRLRLRKAFPGGPLPSAVDILGAEIPYLDGVVEETLRIGGTSVVTSRTATVNTKILGYDIPAGSLIILNMRVWTPPVPVSEERRSATSQAAGEKHHRAGLDGENSRDLDQFNPGRWLIIDHTGKEVFDVYSLPTLTFGGGLRGCFGKKLAMQELKILIALLALNFEFLPVPANFAQLDAEETIFRKPKQCYVTIRAL